MRNLTTILATAILIPTLSMPSYAGRRHRVYQESSTQQYEQRQMPKTPKTNNSHSYLAELPLPPRPKMEQTQNSPNHKKEIPPNHNYNQKITQEKQKKKSKPASFLEKLGIFMVLFGAFQKTAPLEKALDINIDYSVKKMTPQESSKYKQEQRTKKPTKRYSK